MRLALILAMLGQFLFATTAAAAAACYGEYIFADSFEAVSNPPPQPPPGDVCESATALSGTFNNESLLCYSANYAFSAACGIGTPSGADKVYAITIPSGQKLTVTVTPDVNTDVVVAVVPAGTCTATLACLAAADNGGPSAVEVVQYTNQTGVAQSVQVVVKLFSPASAENYTISYSIGF